MWSRVESDGIEHKDITFPSITQLFILIIQPDISSLRPSNYMFDLWFVGVMLSKNVTMWMCMRMGVHEMKRGRCVLVLYGFLEAFQQSTCDGSERSLPWYCLLQVWGPLVRLVLAWFKGACFMGWYVRTWVTLIMEWIGCLLFVYTDGT